MKSAIAGLVRNAGLEIRYLPKLIEQNRENGRRAIRQAVREWVRKGGKGELHS